MVALPWRMMVLLLLFPAIPAAPAATLHPSLMIGTGSALLVAKSLGGPRDDGGEHGGFDQRDPV
jgi:hypothetical protein